MPDTALESTLTQFLLKHASVLVFVTDRHGQILQANQYAESVTGRDLIGVDLSDVVVDFAGNFSIEIPADEQTSSMWSVTTASGLPQTFSFHFIDHGERIIAIGEHNHRHSERLEASLIELNKEVGNMNRDLQKRTAQLERLNEEKNYIIGVAAHDLRNPIGAIHSLSEFLYEDAATSRDDEELEILSTIHDSSGFMLTLIDELLSVSAIESGKVRLNLESTDLNALIAASIKQNQPLAEKKSLRMTVQSSDALPPIPLDRMKMQQVLNNLISNAVKFSQPETAVTVSVSQDGDNAFLTVEDEGPGIPEEDVDKLFKPFSRTSIKATNDEKSTGLGLSIVRRIVEEHKGKIWVDTQVEKGAAFHISLPLSQNHHNKEARNDKTRTY